jgi:hypothetical protein
MTRTGLKANKTPGRKRECESKSGRGEQEGERTYCLRMLPWTTRIDFQIPATNARQSMLPKQYSVYVIQIVQLRDHIWYHLDKQKTASLIVLQRRGSS